MAKNIVKYKIIYLFIIILSLTGFISGIIYYQIQPQYLKEETKELLNIKEELSSPVNNIKKSVKNSGTILLNSILIITQYKNLFNIFYKPFEIGFIFNLLKSYNFKLAIIYNLIYQLLPYIFSIILIRIGLTISISIIKLIIERSNQNKKHLFLLIKKYLIITAILLIYELIISFFSTNINSYLMTFL